MDQLQEYEKKNTFIRKEVGDSQRSVAFAAAQRKVAKLRLDVQSNVRGTIKAGLERFASVRDLNMYEFFLKRGRAMTISELEGEYKQSTAFKIAQIHGFSIDASNSACENVPRSGPLSKCCRL